MNGGKPREQPHDRHNRAFLTTLLPLGFGVVGQMTIPVPLRLTEWDRLVLFVDALRPAPELPEEERTDDAGPT